MWTIFNKTDLQIGPIVIGEGPNGINGKQWSLGPGETAKFPDSVGAELFDRYPFLSVLNKDSEPAKEKVYEPPTDFSAVPAATPAPANLPRFVKHPSSDPQVKATGGFGPAPVQSESQQVEAVGGIRLREALEDGKVVKIDNDGVQWYGEGLTSDTLDKG